MPATASQWPGGFALGGEGLSQAHTPCAAFLPPSPLSGPPTVTGGQQQGQSSTLTVGWAPAAGPRAAYRASWHQEGSQSSPGGLVNLGPDNTSLMLRDLVPGSCYTVSVWTRAGNLSSSIQRARACTREFPAAAPGRPALGSGVGTNILHAPSSVCLTQVMRLVRVALPLATRMET